MATISAETNIQVIGDYSSKITYIVRLILKLQRDHSKDVQPLKILVFSQWTEILHPIAMALTQNGIRHRHNLTPRTIEEFKVVCIYLFIGFMLQNTSIFPSEPTIGRHLFADAFAQRMQWLKPNRGYTCFSCRTHTKSWRGSAGHWTRTSFRTD